MSKDQPQDVPLHRRPVVYAVGAVSAFAVFAAGYIANDLGGLAATMSVTVAMAAALSAGAVAAVLQWRRRRKRLRKAWYARGYADRAQRRPPEDLDATTDDIGRHLHSV